MTEAPSPDRRALLQQALVAIDDLEARLARAEAAGSEPVAIVGMSCRFPGGADSLDAYWELLCAGRDAVVPYPAERLELLRRSGVDPDQLADAAGWHGGFLDEIDRFDPQFFGVSPREAASMDPQQRLLLEVSWEALEHAGIAPTSLHGTPTGVFVGITSTEYAQLGKLGGPEALDVYAATGGALNAAAGRVAYTLGLQGPAMAIDTACSSSLVALHEASQALRAGEATVALAAGVNLLLLPEAFICFESWGMMAPDSRCKAFDAAADGFVRGEGCGVVVLKLLRDAVADGDRVLAVVKGSAVNQDGASSGLTVPNGPAQEIVLRKALEVAGVAPADVQYFEAHGTGTSLGDPIEVEALGAVLRRGRAAESSLILGSVKSNIGHLESAAGIAGLIKVVLSMQHGAIPPNLHLEEPNPSIPWPPFPVVVPTEVTSWPASDGRRVAGVSGFGFSGTNAHVVLESPPVQPTEVAEGTGGASSALVVLSGRTPTAVRPSAGRWASALVDEATAPPLVEIAAAAARGRAHLPHRVGIVAASVAELRTSLEAYAAGAGPSDLDHVVEGQAGHPSVGFVMSGQGSQWVGMGQGLYRAEPVFQESIDRCAAVWAGAVAGRGLLDVMWSGEGLERTEVTQPALFALEWSLARLWGSWGVQPTVVLGHSVGEYVAAVLAGVMSPEDGLGLVATRGRLMGALPQGGSMAAVMAPQADVEEVLADLSSSARSMVGIAAVNGSAHTVVSGADEAVATVVAAFTARGVRVSELVVSHAFHSPLMAPIVDRFGEAVAEVELSSPDRRVVSNVTGGVVGEELVDPVYWARHVLAPVRFADGVAAMRELGVGVFVEVGPHPVLTGMATADSPPDGERWVGSLRRGRDDHRQILAALGEVHVAGGSVAWERVAAAGAGAARAVLPPTPFRHDPHWFPPVATRPAGRAGDHPLLGTRVEAPSLRTTIHHGEVSSTSPAWLADHRLAGAVVFPGSAYLDMFVAASDPASEVVDDVQILEALVLADDSPVTLQTLVERRSDRREVQIVSLTPALEPGGESGWAVHARAVLRPAVAPAAEALEVASLAKAFPDPVDVDAYYALLRGIGLTYGPTFRGLVELRRRNGAAVGRVVLPDLTDARKGHHVHPALLDACFQVLGVAVAPLDGHEGNDMLVPVAVDGLSVHADAGGEAWCVVSVLDVVGPVVSARVELFGPDGAPVATIERLEVRRTPRSVWQRASASRHPVYEVAWRSQPVRSTVTDPEARGPVLVVGAGAGAAALVDEFALAGASVEAVAPDALGVVLAAAPPVGDLVLLAPAGPEAGALDTVASALHAVQDLVATATTTRLWLVTRGGQSVEGEAADPAQAAVWGFGRVVANEHPELDCRLLDLDPAEPSDALADVVAEILADQGGDGVDAVALRAGRRHVARLTRARLDRAAPEVSPYRLDLAERGSLEHLSLRSTARRAPGPDEIEIEVRATGLNFRDVLNVLGMYPGDPGLPGLECAGVVTAVGTGVTGTSLGERVMGIAPCAFDSHVVTSPHLVVPVPVGLSFSEAATVPIAFLTADYGLRRLASLGPADRVLVHAAAGGVGQAAVQIALRIGAEVHATVGSAEKRRHLEALGVEHIYSSRTLDFADEVLAATDGRGVDVVLNSLSDEFVDRSFDVLAPGGRFLEIGKRGVWSAAEAAARRPDAGYHLYDLADFLAADATDLELGLGALADELAAGSLRPLPVRAFPVEAVESAFRFMAQARHIGKVVVTHRPSAPSIRPDGAYLVTGGLGGLGLTVARWLAEQGAAAVVLAGRRPAGAEATAVISDLVASGTEVRVVAADVSMPADLDQVLAEVAATGADLRGVFHLAGVTDDGVVTGQTVERIAGVMAPKLGAAELLDLATRGLDLDHFVLFSSASTLMGAPGQSGYAAANSALDALALRRRAEGRPALSIDWGAWGEVGMAALLEDRERERMAGRGVGVLSPAAAIEALDDLVASVVTQVAVMEVDWTVLAGTATDAVPGLFTEVAAGVAVGNEESPRVPDVRLALAEADPVDRRAVLEAFVRSQVVGVLALDPADEIHPGQGLTDLGMDSLMAVELGNRLRAGLGITLSSTVAFEHPTLEELTDHLSDQLADGGRPEAHRPKPTRPSAIRPPVGVEEVVALSDDEVADRLLQELEESGY